MPGGPGREGHGREKEEQKARRREGKKGKVGKLRMVHGEMEQRSPEREVGTRVRRVPDTLPRLWITASQPAMASLGSLRSEAPSRSKRESAISVHVHEEDTPLFSWV